jgi:hypothetical protein
MLRLIQADLPSTRKLNLRHRTPSGFLYFRTVDAFVEQCLHFGAEVIAHEIQLVPTVNVGWVNSQLRWR